MAVKLGNYINNLNIEENKVKFEYKAKKEYVLSLIEALKPFVERMKDMFDTYWYLKKNYEDTDKDFIDGLWIFLCNDREMCIDINSYFSIKSSAYIDKKIDYYDNIGVSRFGVCVYYGKDRQRLMTNEPDIDSNGADKNVWRGKYDAEKFIKDSDENSVTMEMLKNYSYGLEILLKNVGNYLDKFFELVDKRIVYVKKFK